MDMDMQVKKHMGGYLLSSNFKNLCETLNFDYYDAEDIKEKVMNAEDIYDIEEFITLLIYEKYLLCNVNSSKDTIPKKYLHQKLFDTSTFFYRVFIRNPNRWQDIKNKLHAGIDSGKINSNYLLEKEFQQEINAMSISKVDDALKDIYIVELNHILDRRILDIGIETTLLEEAFQSEYLANPLYFEDVRDAFEKRIDEFLKNPIIKAKKFFNNTAFVNEAIIRNEKLAGFINEKEFSAENGNCIFTKAIGYGSKFFYAVTTGKGKSFKRRDDLSNIYIIKKELVEDCDALLVGFNSDLMKQFPGYVDDSIENIFHKREDDYKRYLLDESNLDDYQSIEFDDFRLEIFRDCVTGETLHVFDALKSEDKAMEYDHRNLFEVVSQKPLSPEYLDLVSSLNLGLDSAYQIQNAAQDENDIISMLTEKIWEGYGEEVMSKKDLLGHLDKLYVKTILNSKEEMWQEIKDQLAHKINSNEIISLFGLQFEYIKIAQSSFKTEILNAKIEALLEFKEKDNTYLSELALYIRDKDILYNGLGNYLNELTEVPEIKQKEYLDEGKFAAPRWLVYPELDAYTIGWRMGYGEDYVMNEPWHTEEFNQLFPKPQNWLFDPRNCAFDNFPPFGYFWQENGKQKYCKIKGHPIEVNDFITIEQEDNEFQYNANKFLSIEHAILFAKYALFGKINFYKTKFYVLKKGFELSDEEISYWQNFKYAVVLNAAYYKFMQDENLKQKLLDTGDESLVYVSDDEWGGSDNLFGFALMELRDEIRRLYENEDLIDWEYTEYLKEKDPYENPQKRNPEDEQSPEYMIISSTLNSSEFYVRDVDLPERLAGRYTAGQILKERAFVDATDRIGGLTTTHRYLIMSNQMKDLSEFENETNWGLHIANAGSKFRVMDIYKKDGKTQIMLLQLPEGFEDVFENNVKIIEKAIEDARALFDKCLCEDAIAEVTSPDWLERVSFPIGMSDDGEFF